MEQNLDQKQQRKAFAPRFPAESETVIEIDPTYQYRPTPRPSRRSASEVQRILYPYDYTMEEDDITSVKTPSHHNSIHNASNDNERDNDIYSPFPIIVTENGHPSSTANDDLLSSLISAPPQPKRSITASDGLSRQALGPTKDNKTLSEDHDDDLDIQKSSSLSSLSGSSSKTLIGKPRPTLYVSKSTPYCSVISGLSTPSKISHSNTHHYLSATEGVGSVAVDVKQEITDPDFDTSLQEKKRPMNKRGVCNLMTIVIILSIIVFMFAGYPLSLYVSKKLHPMTSDSSSDLSAN